jgi:hypothetical protein
LESVKRLAAEADVRDVSDGAKHDADEAVAARHRWFAEIQCGDCDDDS